MEGVHRKVSKLKFAPIVLFVLLLFVFGQNETLNLNIFFRPFILVAKNNNNMYGTLVSSFQNVSASRILTGASKYISYAVMMVI